MDQDQKTYATGTPSPSAKKILDEKGIDAKDIQGSGVDGRITKEDALKSKVDSRVSPETIKEKRKNRPISRLSTGDFFRKEKQRK
ncbi:MAG: E3 binding domain-containing protein [Sphingobacteriales bacterium]|nr:E3 binding domain-containing protein [Sphingobacteriales bacterium]